MIARLSCWIDRVNGALGRAVAWLTLLMVLATATVVLMRYLFQINTLLIQETVIYLHALVLAHGIAYTLKAQGHVRVDILYLCMSERRRALLDGFGHLLLALPVAILIGVISLPYVMASWRVLESSSEVGGLPAVFLLKSLIPVLALLLGLQAISEAAKAMGNLPSAHEGPPDN